MAQRPAQFTLRSVVWATVCMSVCFLHWRILQLGYVPVAIYFGLVEFWFCAAVIFLVRDGATSSRYRPVRWFVVAILIWLVTSLVLLYGSKVAIVDALLVRNRGSHYSRMMVAYLTATIISALVAFRTMRFQLRFAPSRRISAMTLTGWIGAVVLMLVGGNAAGIDFFDRYQTEEIVAGWLLFATPIAGIALWMYSGDWGR